MSILKRLFGGRNGAGVAAAAEMEIDGVHVTATPMEESGQFRLCALLSKQIGGETRVHRMIRADIFPSREEAIEAAFRKARRLIEEQGDTIFS